MPTRGEWTDQISSGRRRAPWRLRLAVSIRCILVMLAADLHRQDERIEKLEILNDQDRSLIPPLAVARSATGLASRWSRQDRVAS